MESPKESSNTDPILVGLNAGCAPSISPLLDIEIKDLSDHRSIFQSETRPGLYVVNKQKHKDDLQEEDNEVKRPCLDNHSDSERKENNRIMHNTMKEIVECKIHIVSKKAKTEPDQTYGKEQMIISLNPKVQANSGRNCDENKSISAYEIPIEEDDKLDAIPEDLDGAQFERGPSITSVDGLLESNPSPSNEPIGLDGRQGQADNQENQPDVAVVNINTNNVPDNTNNPEEENPDNLNIQTRLAEINEILRTEKIISRSYKSKLRRICVGLAAIFLGSFFVPYVTYDSISIRPLFVSIYVGLGYYFLESLYITCKSHVNSWEMVDDLFKTLDVLSLISFIVLLDLHFTSGFNITKVALAPHVAFATLYHFASATPQGVKEPQTAHRVFFAIQLVLITIKIDGDVNWSWKIILCLLWFYFGMLIFYFILLVLVLLAMLILGVFGKKVYENISYTTQFIGGLWQVAYIGIGAITFVAAVGATLTLENEYNTSIVKICLLVARYLSIAMIVYLTICSESITQFLRKINNEQEPNIEDYLPNENGERLMGIQIEKKLVHLVRMSSTYFLPLKDSFTLKDKTYLQKLKKSIKESKDEKFKRDSARKIANLKRKAIACGPVSIEDLKRDKEALEKKLETLKKQSVNKGQQNNKGNKRDEQEVALGIHHSFVQNYHKEGIAISDFSTVMRNRKGVCLSEGDQENFHQLDMFENNEDIEGNDGNKCYICVQEPCNAVIMNCGHGGVCYECALEFVKTKNQCMECRQKVEKVIKVDPDPKMRNIILGYESVKLVFA